MNIRKKRVLIGYIVLVAFAIYFLGPNDPDSGILQNLPFGGPLLLAVGVIVVAAVGHWILESLYDFFIDPIYGDVDEARKVALDTSTGAGLLLLARAINLLAGAIIVAAAIIKML